MQSLSELSSIIEHLKEVATLRIPLSVRLGKELCCPNAHLVSFSNLEPKLSLKLTRHRVPENRSVRLEYSIGGKAFEFQSDVISTDRLDGEQTISHLAWPTEIQIKERRVYIRTKLAPTEALTFHLLRSDEPPLLLLVESLSGGGIGFFAPRGVVDFSVGRTFDIRILLRADQPLVTKVVVRSVLNGFEMVRVGAEFIGLSVPQRMALIEYVAKTQANHIGSITKSCSCKKNDILVVTDRLSDWSLPDLEEQFAVWQTKIKEALGQLRVASPELIILDLDNDGAASVLKKIKSIEKLKALPLIIASEKSGIPMLNTLDIRLVQWPIETAYLKTVIFTLLSDYQNALMWQEQLTVCSSQCTNLQNTR